MKDGGKVVKIEVTDDELDYFEETAKDHHMQVTDYLAFLASQTEKLSILEK